MSTPLRVPSLGTPQNLPLLPDLCVRVLDEEVGQRHDEDGNGHPKVPDQAPHLCGGDTVTTLNPPVSPPMSPPSRPHHQQPQAKSSAMSLRGLSQGTAHPAWDMGTPPCAPPLHPHPARQEGAVLELAEEEGQEEGSGHEDEGQQRRVGLRHVGLHRVLHVVPPRQRVVLEDLRRGRRGSGWDPCGGVPCIPLVMLVVGALLMHPKMLLTLLAAWAPSWFPCHLSPMVLQKQGTMGTVRV